MSLLHSLYMRVIWFNMDNEVLNIHKTVCAVFGPRPLSTFLVHSALIQLGQEMIDPAWTQQHNNIK